MLIIDPPAIAGGTDLFQVRLLTFEATPSRQFLQDRIRQIELVEIKNFSESLSIFRLSQRL